MEVLLEEIRSQNRTILNAIETSRAVLIERIDRFEERTEQRFAAIVVAIRSTNVCLAALEARLERRGA